MKVRRLEEEALHGPWPDQASDPDQQVLDGLREEFGTRWRIWRAMDPGKVPGEWCARRITPADGSLRAVSADTAEGLRTTLRKEAER